MLFKRMTYTFQEVLVKFTCMSQTVIHIHLLSTSPIKWKKTGKCQRVASTTVSKYTCLLYYNFTVLTSLTQSVIYCLLFVVGTVEPGRLINMDPPL